MTVKVKRRNYTRIRIIAFVFIISAMFFNFCLYNNASAKIEENQEQIIKVSSDYNDTRARMQEVLRENQSLKSEMEELRAREVSRGYGRKIDVVVTAYDLSVASCGKSPNHPSYGITATGRNLSGESLESARAIAVDPDIIPLGSKVRIAFHDESMQQYNGIYTACDTGGAIEGNRIDLFAGEDGHDIAMKIGRRRATIQIL